LATGTPSLVGNSLAEHELPEGLTRKLIELVRGVEFDTLPETMQRRVKHSLTDTLGVAALGSAAGPVQTLRSVVLDPTAGGKATVFGPTSTQAHPLAAAMVNALAGHIRDFDDAGGGGHVSAIIVPVTLALAEARDGSGADVLSGLVSGYETAFRISRLLTNSHYYLGFHSSGTSGTFGATAAACRMLDLTPEAWSCAFGIAGSLANGLLANFGSMTKPLHSANAARAGILAASLAQGGYTGTTEILEDASGFVATHTTRSDPAAALAPLGSPWALEGMMYKFNAACSGTHSGADGIRRLMREHALSPNDVAHVILRVPRIQTEVANIPRPTTVEQAKFSIRFVAASALLGRNTAEGFPTDDNEVVDPAVQAAIEMIDVLPIPGVNHGGAAEIELKLRSGYVLRTDTNSMVPFDDLDAEWEAVTEKFRRTAATLWSTTAIEDAAQRLARFENEPSARAFLADLTGA
jgi:2-methylcitrate dehydratase PrpD